MAEQQKRNVSDDRYARESFTFRRMTRRQAWAISTVVIVLAVALIAYSL